MIFKHMLTSVIHSCCVYSILSKLLGEGAKSPFISLYRDKEIKEREPMKFLRGFVIKCEQRWHLLGKP